MRKVRVKNWVVGGLIGSLLFGASAPAVRAAAPPPSVVYEIAKIDDGLKPEGGTFALALHFRKGEGALPAGALTLVPSFADGWGRTFWEGPPVAFSPGDKANPTRLEFAIPYPPLLPIGGYLFRGVIRDATGGEVTTVRVPTGRFERFDFQRDLVWMYWGGRHPSDQMAAALQGVGINGCGGDSLDYRFPYRWFKDHAVQEPTERYPEDAFLHPEGTQLAWYRKAHIGSAPADGGFVLALMTDEVGANYKSPAMRAARLRLARTNSWLNVPTLSRFNSFFQTDYLSWDEVLRDGFPQLNHPLYKDKPMAWTADREFRDIEAPMLHVEVLRQTNPSLVFGPGATHCLTDGHFDSFNTRAYNNMTTLDFIAQFIAAQPMYGLRPGNRLINLHAGWVDGTNYFAANEHLFWSALACNDRLFLIYGPGDGYGATPVSADGKITPEGEFLQTIRRTIHGLRSVILATHNRLEPAVLYLNHDWHEAGRNLMEGLVNCGVMPRGAKAPDAATKLIFGLDAVLGSPVLEAVNNGAGLVLGGKEPGDLSAVGIEVSTNVLPATDGEEIDLAPLAKAFPGLANVKVIGTWGAGAKAKAGSGLTEVRVGDKLLAISGPMGKGWVLYLNVNLQTMFQPNGWRGSWGAVNLSLLGDPTIPDRNAALVRALLARAGVPERFRLTNAQGQVHPLLRGMLAESADGAQPYLYVVSEAAGKLVKDPADPKKDTITLACDRQLTGTLRLLDPSIKAVRDLRTGRLLPVRADAQGVAVDLQLPAGQGTILALLTAVPTGTLAVHLSQNNVAGLEQLQVELCRRDQRGELLALPGHSCWVRFLDPQGREVEALSRWATGGGPHVFDAAFALNDPEGEWTVEAEDLTDGTRAQAKLTRQRGPHGLRLEYLPAGNVVRGAPNQGVLRIHNAGPDPLPLAGLTAACDAPGIRLSLSAMTGTVPAGGESKLPVTLEIDPACPAGPALLELRHGDAVLGAARVAVPEPFTVTFESTPYFDGDLILTEIRGSVRTSAAGRVPIVIRPAGLALPEIVVTSQTAYAETAFAIPLIVSRAQAQALRGLRNEGIDLTLQASGLPAGRANYKPNILPLARAPQPIGSISGGKLAVRINNFTKTEQRVAIVLAPLPGGAAEPWKESRVLPSQSSQTLERPVAGLVPTIDPGVLNLALDWTTGESPRERTVLPVEEVLEQEWWVKTELVSLTAPARADDEVPVLPPSAAERTAAGWHRVVTQSVLWWEELAPKQARNGRLYAAMQVQVPTARKVRVGFTGPTPPERLWVNGELLDVAWRALAKTGGLSAEPIVLSAGSNSVVMALDLPAKKQSATALILQDPATGKRDRAVQIGKPIVAGREPDHE